MIPTTFVLASYATGISKILARYRRRYPAGQADATNIRDRTNQRKNYSFIRKLGGQK